MSPPSAVTIERMRCHYILPRGHPAPESARAGWDALVSRDLSGALASLLGGAMPLDGMDEGMCFVRRLDIRLSFDSAAASFACLRSWAKTLGRAVLDEMAPGDNENVVRFSSR